MRQVRESARADRAETAMRVWRRAWHRIYLECLLYCCAGYVLYGVSFHLTSGNRAAVLVAMSFVVAYVVPLFRLMVFYLRHSDDF